MKATSQFTKDAWLSGDYTGDQRPMARVTVQKLDLTLITYELDKDQIITTSVKDHRGKLASVPFGQLYRPVELPNLASVRWQRDADTPVATATLEFYNTEPLPLGQEPLDGYTFDQPGFFTYNRGDESFSTRWNYVNNGWRGLLAPDRVLRTYEGYGFDPDVAPDKDPHMYPSGVWLIDDVSYTADGMITVTARDIGRVLIDHICFPPVIPWAEYPIIWTAYHDVANPPIVTQVDAWIKPTWETDSNQAYIGRTDITDAGHPYISSNGTVYGHHGRDAFDGNTSSYWLSVGNQATWSSAFEYVQGTLPGSDVDGVKIRVHGGSYHGFISVYTDKWEGNKIIPYVHRVVDTKANIAYVKDFNVPINGEIVVKLPKTYTGVTKIRITLNRLWNSGLGYNYKFRGAISEISVSAKTNKTSDGGTHVEGNYGDYTDIVKWFLSWAGFYWPKSGSGQDFVVSDDGTKTYYHPTSDDPIFPMTTGGRVWGDFMETGTYGPADLGIDVWDKKPLLDCITYIRDIVNFLFVIGEDGGVIWRTPNIWQVGNYVWDPLGQSPARTAEVVEIDEKQTLIDLTTKLSSRNMRERVFVGNVAGNFGAIAKGFQPHGYGDPGLRRVAGWTDQRFNNTDECQRMADLITLRQMFTFRQNQLTIAANPAIQVDDQVRIYERVTNEGFIHYVQGIQSDWNLADGKWTYQLTTHWLGEAPFATWAFDPANLSAETQAYLTALGVI